MKKLICVMLCMMIIFSLAACGKEEPVPTPAPTMVSQVIPTPEPTVPPTPAPTPEPLPLQPELPPVVDEGLNAVLDSITVDVQSGTAGSSLKAARCAAQLLDWGSVTALSDDEIYSAVGTWLQQQDDQRLMMFLENILVVYDASYDLRGENAQSLMDTAGITSSAYPWNERAFRAVEMVSYGCGLR